MTTGTATERFVKVAGGHVHVLEGGTGAPLAVLHDDIGVPGWTPFHEALAARFTVYVPSLPGFGRSERPDWARDVRDLAVLQLGLLRALGLDSVTLVGTGFGGWVAAELATMCPERLHRLVLVGAAGIQPREGEIADQFLMSGLEYAQQGFRDPAAFAALYGREPDLDQREAWEINREMVCRVAWSPYMFNPSLPYLLELARVPTLVVWGSDDAIVPLDCGRQYAERLPDARLEVVEACGHHVDLERPQDLARLVAAFAA